MMQWKIHTDTLSRGHGSPIVYACSDLVKYSNGGCSGFEPDFLFIYSAYNFSKPYLFNIIRLYCSPWRNARKGVFGGKMPVFAIPSVTLPCGARRNCKSLRSKTFGKYYIIPRGLLQVLARQITSRREKGQGILRLRRILPGNLVQLFSLTGSRLRKTLQKSCTDVPPKK